MKRLLLIVLLTVFFAADGLLANDPAAVPPQPEGAPANPEQNTPTNVEEAPVAQKPSENGKREIARKKKKKKHRRKHHRRHH